MTTLIAAAIVVAGLYFGRDILIPLALAILLSFLLTPLVRGLERLRAGRALAVSLAVLAASVPTVGFVAILVGDVASLAQRLPEYEDNFQAKIASLKVPGGVVFERLSTALDDIRRELARSDNRAGRPTPHGPAAKPPLPVEVVPPASTPLQTVQTVIAPLLGPLGVAGLVGIFVIWILLDREDLRDRVLRLAGGGDLHRTTEAMNEAADRVGRYLRTQLAVNTGCAVPIGLGLALIGIPYAGLWAIFVVLLRFLPYLGIIIAAAFPVALALAVDPGWHLLLWTLLLFVGVESVVANLLEPRLYGASTGLSPLAVIVGAVFWTWLWGPVGLLLATPVTVCLVVLGRHAPALGLLGVLLGNEPVLSPEETFYQRLLAGDPEEASEQAEEFAKEASLGEFFDTVALPALAMAQSDSDRGILPAERRAVVAQGIDTMLDNLAEEGFPPDATGARTVCIAGRNKLDRAAAALLAFLAAADGSSVRVLGAEAIAAGDFHRLDAPGLVLLSLVSTNSPARARYLVRRLRRYAPRARLVVGFWTGNGPAVGEAEARAIGADAIVGSLRAAAAEIAALEAAATAPAIAGAGQ